MFVFFHIGEDLTLPTALVRSILAHNPGAEVIQVTDRETPTIPGVTWSHATDVDPKYLLLCRTSAWADLGLDEPALYLDTDMIVNGPISPLRALGEASVAMCRRSFYLDALFNPHQRGLDFSEYAGKTLGEVYPYVGCATITQDAGVWADLTEMYYALPEKYWRWYGDQEVLREYAKRFPVLDLPESVWGGLPEFGGHPLITHYKGGRKKLLAH